MASKKFYTVWIGKIPGVYTSWSDAEENVKGFKGAKFKSFASQEEATTALAEPWTSHIVISQKKVESTEPALVQEPEPVHEFAEASFDDEFAIPDHNYGMAPDESPF